MFLKGWNTCTCFWSLEEGRTLSLCCIGRKGQTEITHLFARSRDWAMFCWGGGERHTFPARRFDRTFSWELQRKFEPLTTSGGSKTRGKDTEWLQNSERTNKVQGGHEQRSFRKSCGGAKMSVSSTGLSCWLRWWKANYRKYHLMQVTLQVCPFICLSWKVEPSAPSGGSRKWKLSTRQRWRGGVSEQSLWKSLFWDEEWICSTPLPPCSCGITFSARPYS